MVASWDFLHFGDDVEPCFEGASFYSLEDNIIALLEKIWKKNWPFPEPWTRRKYNA